MKKLTCCLIFLGFSTVFAQKIENVKGTQVDNKAIVTYDLVNADSILHYVSLYYSMDGGRSFGTELKRTTGDVRNNILAGTQRRIVWDIDKEVNYIQGDVIFRVNAEPKGIKKRSQGESAEPDKQRLFLSEVAFGYKVEVTDCMITDGALTIVGKMTASYNSGKITINKQCTQITNENNDSFANPDGKIGNLSLGEQSYFIRGAAVPFRMVFKDASNSVSKLTLAVCLGDNKVIRVKNIPVF